MLQLNADDYDIEESVIDLVNAFATALSEKDRTSLDDVYYLACGKISKKCSCYEIVCICE